ncbi:mitochondrial GTPase 1 isoform X2 [Zootermopsis nevadensis]|uniref:mitochondrial GTPase 1 isoform X2 n=1 Tax=Zootermopsis nevadensis TaxID=136037 RepID=UPI000B8E5199|nr:mitochondrial GTPase 1 isoform X2 [Zootermopsis nevadensis]
MAQRVANSLYNFRETFRVVNKDVLRWFPGHMGKGLRQMQQRLKLVDCVIEVHDARIPLSGRNPNFRHTVSGVKPHILVLNKKDLSDLQMKSEVEAVLRKDGFNHIFYSNCKDSKCPGMKQIIPAVVKLVSSSERYNRSEEKDFSVMVIGVPNVGKSSLINALRSKYLGKGKAAPVGAVAGITRSVQNRIKVSDKPLVYLLDTPGILTPNISDTEMGLRLALCACLQDHLVGVEIIADYLLYWLNKNNKFRYLEIMGLDEPTDDIGTVLTKCAVKLGKAQRRRDVVVNMCGDQISQLLPTISSRRFEMETSVE